MGNRSKKGVIALREGSRKRMDQSFAEPEKR